MKRTLPFIFILAFISSHVYSQEPPRKANKIILSNSLSKEENYKEVGRILLDSDLIIDFTDKELGFINAVLYDDHGIDIKIKIVIKDREVTVTGKYGHYLDSPMRYSTVENSGWITRDFSRMNNLALKLPHDKVDYGIADR